MLLRHQIRDAMIAHARFCSPLEACGLLAVDDLGEPIMAYCLTNVDASRSSFTVDPTEHYQAIRHAERNGWQIGGVFHSHPRSSAVPSNTDVERALDPKWLYVIVGRVHHSEPEIRGFRVVDGSVTEVEMVDRALEARIRS